MYPYEARPAGDSERREPSDRESHPQVDLQVDHVEPAVAGIHQHEVPAEQRLSLIVDSRLRRSTLW